MKQRKREEKVKPTLTTPAAGKHGEVRTSAGLGLQSRSLPHAPSLAPSYAYLTAGQKDLEKTYIATAVLPADVWLLLEQKT